MDDAQKTIEPAKGIIFIADTETAPYKFTTDFNITINDSNKLGNKYKYFRRWIFTSGLGTDNTMQTSWAVSPCSVLTDSDTASTIGATEINENNVTCV